MHQVYFCGIGVPHRCVTVHLASVHPHGMSDINDLVQSTEVLECFDGNAIEVEIMLEYLGTQHIFHDIYMVRLVFFSPEYMPLF